MLTYKEQSQQITDQAFLARVQQGAVEVALAVMAESASVSGHEERAVFAQRALFGDVSLIVARGVVTNPNCGTGTDDPLEDDASGDSAMEFVISSMWNAFSNYSATP